MLDRKKRMYCYEYAVDLNQTQAAIRAGYSPKSAHVQACKMMKDPEVRAFIDKILGKANHRAGLKRSNILKRLSDNLNREGFFDLIDKDGNFISDARKIPKESLAFIDGFEVYQTLDEEGNVVGQKIKIKLSPNAAAQDMAMKYIGAYAAEKKKLELVGKPVIDYDQLRTPADLKTIDVVGKRLALEEGKNGDS